MGKRLVTELALSARVILEYLDRVGPERLYPVHLDLDEVDRLEVAMEACYQAIDELDEGGNLIQMVKKGKGGAYLTHLIERSEERSGIVRHDLDPENVALYLVDP